MLGCDLEGGLVILIKPLPLEEAVAMLWVWDALCWKQMRSHSQDELRELMWQTWVIVTSSPGSMLNGEDVP